MSDASTAALRYSPPAQAFHWLTVLFVAAAWTLGVLGDDLPKGSIRHMGEFVHVILGEMVALLLLLRVVWRFVTPAPALETTRFGAPALLATRLVHLALYALLVAVPVVGVVTLFHGGEPLSLFGVVDIPSPWPRNRELKHYSKEIHELLAHALVLLAVLHASAALAHHYVMKDRALKRMLPAFLGAD
ncbi:cytochrome b [Methylocystis parvus]|uniref:Cytochrome b n=1 Tax=Methylocystis parvus TaxID=134 RepID=A0A6B8M4B4_9HYPH|nr:cytochrome b/b6 domain-containing protein [Methylocystis parvus]QGM98764.1 cytochrome b [Methylocystis parvus]WBK00885.1 cytochrome b/b6 domain-containing protein [Methylocystis parvus OBBP]